MSGGLTIRFEAFELRSVPERELLGFIHAVTELLGTQQASVLTEIWLDELACLEALPEPTSTQWRLVTLGAWARLAERLFDACLFVDSA